LKVMRINDHILTHIRVHSKLGLSS
jgi:hypothetical protein